MGVLADILYQIRRLFQWWIVLTPWEEAARYRAFRFRGKPRLEKIGEGIHLRIPYLDKFYVQSVRRRVANMPSMTVTTSDGHALTLSGIMFYEISDIMKLYQKLHHAEDTIAGLANAAIAEYVATHTKDECTPMAVASAANAAFSTRSYGIRGTEIALVTFAYVKTYRLISGDAESFSFGDALSTGPGSETA